MARLRELVARHGTAAAAARAIALNGCTFREVLRGAYGPGPKVYHALGLVPPVDLLPPAPNDVGMRTLHRRVRRCGSIAAAAQEMGVAPNYLGDVLNGRKPMGPKIYRAISVERPTGTRDVEPADEGMRVLHRYVRQCGSITAAAGGLGIAREQLSMILNGRSGMGPKLYRALGLDADKCRVAEVERRKGIARELKRQAWERGMMAIPRDRLGEIR